MNVANDIQAFLSGLSSVDQDRFAVTLQAITRQASAGSIEEMREELKRVQAEIAKVNEERDKLRREQDDLNAVIAKLDAAIVQKPTSAELRLLRYILSQRAARLEWEIGARRPHKSLQRKCELRRDILLAEQMQEIVNLTGVLAKRG